MDSQGILWLIFGILITQYLFSEILDYINLKFSRPDIPNEMKGYYDEEKYQKSQEYQKVTTRFSFLTSTLSFVVILGILGFGFFGQINSWLSAYFQNEVILALAFFGVLFISSDILTIPFQWYSTFVIEERFGFNKTTRKTFFLDKVKGYVLTAILGGGILWLLMYLITSLGQEFWIYFWIAISLVILFINMFFTTLILPLFNKLTPLPEGELKDALTAYAEKVKFPLTNIFVIDGSKRSKKSNAFFSGIGKKKKVVLYDTLIDNHNTEELVAVLAHEVGHYKKKHIIWGFALSILQVGLTLFVMSLMIFNKDLSLALGGTDLTIHLNLLAFGMLYAPMSGVIGLFMNMLSRKNEFEADEYATSTYDGSALKTALKKLSVDNLSNLFPHPAYVFFHYSHPPILKRLEAIDRLEK